MIEVSLPSGQVAEFPDGTDPETIRAAMARLAGDISRETAGAPPPGHRDMSLLGADLRTAGAASGVGAVAPPRDPGFMSEAAGALESSFGAPIAGGMEMLRDFGQAHPIASKLVAGGLGGAFGLAALEVAAHTKPGITQEETADAAARRQAYLDAHPDDAHAAAAFGTELGAQVLPSLVPVAGAGDVAGTLARAAIPSALRAAAPTAAEVLAGAAGGAATGAGFGYVSSYGLTPDQRLQAAKTGALVGVAGGTLGGLASGIRARETAARAQEAGANLPQEPPPPTPPDLAPLADRYLAERDQAAQAAQGAMPQLVEQARQYLAARQQFPNLPESARPALVPDELLAAVRQEQASPTAPGALTDPATNAAAVRAVVDRAQQAIDAKWHPIFDNLAAQQPDPNVHAAADATQAAAAPEIQAPPYQRVESPQEQRLRAASPLAAEPRPSDSDLAFRRYLDQSPVTAERFPALAPDERQAVLSDFAAKKPGLLAKIETERQIASSPPTLYRGQLGDFQPDNRQPLTWFSAGDPEFARLWPAAERSTNPAAAGLPERLYRARGSGLRLATVGDLPQAEYQGVNNGLHAYVSNDPGVAALLDRQGFDGLVQHEGDHPTVALTPNGLAKVGGLTPAGSKGEAGFLQLGKNKPPANVDPFEAVMPSDPGSVSRQASGQSLLNNSGDRFYHELIAADQAPVTMIRRRAAQLPEGSAERVQALQVASVLEKMGSEARAGARIAQAGIQRGTYGFDPKTNNNIRTGDGLPSLLAGADEGTIADLNALMGAQRHMELLDRQQAAEAARAQWLPTLKAAGVKADVDALLAQTKDADLSINPEGTRLAQGKLAELTQRYAPQGGTGQLETLAQGVRGVLERGVIDQLVDIGYLTPEEKADIMGKGQSYAGMYRLLQSLANDKEVVPGGTTLKPIKRISGGLDPENPIMPPLDAAVMQLQRVQMFAAKQRVRNYLADFADSDPQGVGQEIYQARRGPMGLAARDSFPVFRNGQRFDYSAPKMVLEAVNGVPPKSAGLLMQAAQASARLKRAGVVITPEFAAAHFFRFQVDATGFGAGETMAGKKFSYTPIDFFRGLMAMTPEGRKLSPLYDNAMQAGVGGASIVSSDPAIAEATIKDVAGVGGLGGRILRNWQNEHNIFAKIMYPLLAPMEGTTRTLDLATRIGAFRKAKLAGASDLEAGAFARDLLDYNRAGTMGRQYNGVHAFLNPELQATDRFVRAMRDQPVATTLKGLSYMTLPAIANWYRWHNDPDYQAKQPWEKMAFLHLWKREDGSFVRIPRPLGLLNLAFSYGVHNALDHLYAQDPDATHNLAVALTDLTPAHFVMKGGKLSPYGALPSILSPAVEAASGEAGYSPLTDRSIVPQGLMGELPEDRQLDSTSAVASRVGGALGIAPLKIDYLIQGYGGTAGRVATHLLDTPLGKQDLPPLPVRAHDLPLVGRFVDAPAVGWGSDPVSKFYALADSASQASQSLKVAAEGGDAHRYQQILKDHPEALLESTLSSTRADLSQLRKTRQEIRKMEGLTPQQRYDALLSIDQAATAMAGGMMHGVADYLRGTHQ